MIPGELLVAPGEIELNAGRTTVRLTVANTGDRPIQVGSHFHFFETNESLRFDRAKARGFRLNIAAGTAVRFEPGQERAVELVALAGDRIVYGFNAKVMGPLDSKAAKKAAAKMARPGTAVVKTSKKSAKKSAKKSVRTPAKGGRA